MFGDNRAFSAGEVFLAGGSGRHGHGSIPVRVASLERLTELVYHLGDAPLGEVRRAVRQADATCDDHDPLALVAAALLQLRRSEIAHLSIGV